MGAYHNEIITLFTSAARTTHRPSDDFENIDGRGVRVVIDVTAIAASPSVVFTIQGKDHVSGKYYDLLASAAVTGTGTTVLTVYPGIAATANVAASNVLPLFWRINVVGADADSITYSVGACTII